MASWLWRARETVASRLHGRLHMAVCPFCRAALRHIRKQKVRRG